MFSRRLVRSRTDRMIAGVCGGIAETYGINATLVRLLFVAATLLGFSGVLLYIIAWFLMPEY
ncbi:PspC domain-containing protein [Corynebacterium breve]